jgi:hypothetical protein
VRPPGSIGPCPWALLFVIKSSSFAALSGQMPEIWRIVPPNNLIK